MPASKGIKPKKEFRCCDCGTTFLAARSDAQRCEACKLVHHRGLVRNFQQKHKHPRPIYRYSCEECGKRAKATRNDARFCKPCVEQRKSRKHESAKAVPCPECGTLKMRGAVRCRPCADKKRSLESRGAANHFYKGGVTYTSKGYRFVLDPRPSPRSRYVAEHRLVWQLAHGPLLSTQHIHHLNGDKLDNRLENLVPLSNSEHRKMHEDVDGKRSSYIQQLEARIRELEK